MGVNIIVYEKKGYDEEGYIELDNAVKSGTLKFDTLRMSGDGSFASCGLFNRIPDKKEGTPEDYFYRPSDFTHIRNWVNENIIEGNKKRLLDLIDELEKNENLVLRFAW